MLPQHFDLLKGLVNPNYVEQGAQARNSRSKHFTALFIQRRLPDVGWKEDDIQALLDEMASFDTNNFEGNVGVGEREGRVISDLVRRRHFGLTHGIGRSGDVMAEQPKAAGSSLLVQLTRYLALDAIRLAGIKAAKACAVLPAATGLTMTLVFLALRQMRPEGKYVVWSRIDQKSCFKAIGAAGLKPIVVELKPIEGTDALGTDLEGMRSAIEQVGADEVLCICTTTSTFAPRVPDFIDEVAVMAQELQVPHVINNAYGLQCSKCAHLVETGCRRGRVDAFVQSTDKNFMVPVGGAIVAAPSAALVDKVSGLYPGRASMSPVLDLFITLLSLGAPGWTGLLQERKENAKWFEERLGTVSSKLGLRVLKVPANRISFCIDLSPLGRSTDGAEDMDHLTFLGSALFTRRVSGPRVVLCTPKPGAATLDVETPADTIKVKGKYQKVIDGTPFECYGAHTNFYPCCYLTAACAIGASRKEMDAFLERLEAAVQDYKNGAGRKEKSGIAKPALGS
ncbi:O-phosphoseryl-tRNA(Sec) selenium transferase (Liver-pancreas antigen) (LP) (SLA-p35) (SLA/LP autoantigen) (Selenocysteine synthase) (Sec synthase) (Selenocysteinyl-tRNA(Sec) synthase) (Sep-tRNA:Sec-tRNA synthase) (SepSecS) (Soluble liver antigen) (SLA) (UGA suppressor tRNA-associated protein) (tRNA(Ser/Sec)-associated antigenic protein) [Durusdinium trenchii]|uniref:O-phosphoseryl-tRNA(Sec) selenium transferase n=1 Tax=Durusdinium trenchii TaxID=1381693 RepID=A0ABP0RW74_9DINO